jgi:hypothetical protein
METMTVMPAPPMPATILPAIICHIAWPIPLLLVSRHHTVEDIYLTYHITLPAAKAT